MSRFSSLQEQIVEVSWKDIEGPNGLAGYDCAKPPLALRRLISCDFESRSSVYHEVLSAIGNNRGGSYFPAAIAALPILLDVAMGDAGKEPQYCALEILIDLCWAFDPDNSDSSISRERMIQLKRAEVRRYSDRLGILKETSEGSLEEQLGQILEWLNEEN